MIIAEALKSARIAPIEAEILLAKTIKKDRSFLHAYPEQELTKPQERQYTNSLKSREKNEPLAYILGYKEFYGLKIIVNQDVLIPREETEVLVETALDKIKGLTNPVVADIGTGSGCIAISLAVNNPHVKVYAADISEKALETARKNADLHRVSNRITFLKGDLTSPISIKVDLVVANLPYISTARIKQLEPEVKDFEPYLSLDGGSGGMQLYEKLFRQATTILKPTGLILYEVDGKVFSKKF